MAKPKVSMKEIAETANALAQNALGNCLVTSIVLDVMITALVESGGIGKIELAAAFEKGHAFIHEQAPADEMKELVLSTYRNVAAGHGVELKPIK